MRNKKGFTLVELLAVIVILGIIISFSTIAINKIKKDQDKKNDMNTISSILTGAKKYATDHPASTSVLVSSLISGGYVDFDTAKYDTYDSATVNYAFCNDALKLKRAFYINVTPKTIGGSSTYINDCGCAAQVKGADGEKLCEGQNGTTKYRAFGD